MVMIQPDAASSALKTLQIESTQLLPNVLPTIAIGDILRVTVRQNPAAGLGLIYFKGLLVKADLPKNVAVGDKLLAKITESNNNVVLKILEREPGLNVNATGLGSTELVADLQELADQVGSTQFRALRSTEIKELLQRGVALQNTIQQALNGLPQSEQLGDSSTLLRQLQSASSGALSPKFREIANELRNLVEKHGPPPVLKEMTQLRAQLTALLTEAADNNLDAAGQIFRMLDLSHTALKERTRLAGGEAENTRALLDRARALVKNGQLPLNLPAQQKEIQSVLQEATKYINAMESRLSVDSKTAHDILRLAMRFEQMAQTHDTIAKLNPVLQALGEPALILFPFLAQGLIAHSEVTIESKRVKNEEKEDGKKSKPEPYQRIQISVPLPSLGVIDVDIAHRKNEILVRFTSQEKEVGAFLLEQLENLAGTLRDLGFERADLIAHVGEKQENLPAWSYGLHAGRSIIA